MLTSTATNIPSGVVAVKIILQAGVNIIRIYNDEALAPDLDWVTVESMMLCLDQGSPF